MNHHARVERQQPLGRGQQRIDVDFLNPRLFDDQFAEAHHQGFQGQQIHWLAPADALQGLEYLGLLHHAQGQSAVQRRQSQRTILENLNQLPAGSKQQNRAELRVNARAENDLVAFKFGHGLYGHALEVLGTGLLGHRLLDALESLAYRIRIAQVQDHATHVGFVADGERVQLQYDRIAHPVGYRDRLLLAEGDLGRTVGIQ